MPSLRLAVDDQIISPRGQPSGRSARSTSGLGLSAHVPPIPAATATTATDASALTPRGTRRQADVHPVSAERLTPRGSRREEASAPQPPPEGPTRSDSQIPPAPPSLAHITRPGEAAPVSTSSDGSEQLSPRSAKKQNKAQEKAKRAEEKAEEKAKRAEEKAEEKAKRAEDKAKRAEDKAEEKRLEAERKAKKEDKKLASESRKGKPLHRQNSAPNLRAASPPTSPVTDAPQAKPMLSQRDHKFSTVALGRGAALAVPPETEHITVTTTPSMPTSSKPDGKQKQGHVLLLKKALTIPNWRKRFLSYANGSLSIHKKEVRDRFG